MTALVVDDELILAELLSEELNLLACHSDYRGDVVSAVNAIKENRYDIVFTDFKMPGGGGEKIIDEISKISDYEPQIYIITGNTELSLKKAVLMGAKAVIYKPIHLKLLSDILSSRFVSLPTVL